MIDPPPVPYSSLQAQIAMVVAATLMAAVPLYALLRGRTFGVPPRLSVGRHAVLYAAFFAASLVGMRFVSITWTLVAYSVIIACLAYPRVRQLAMRFLAGKRWAEANYETIVNQAALAFIPLTSIAIFSFIAALLVRVMIIGLRSAGAP